MPRAVVLPLGLGPDLLDLVAVLGRRRGRDARLRLGLGLRSVSASRRRRAGQIAPVLACSVVVFDAVVFLPWKQAGLDYVKQNYYVNHDLMGFELTAAPLLVAPLLAAAPSVGALWYVAVLDDRDSEPSSRERGRRRR